MSTLPSAARRSGEDLVDALLDRARQSAHAVAFAKEIFGRRGDYQDALSTLRRVAAEDRHQLFAEALQRAYLNDHERLEAAEFRTNLLVEWIDVLLQAVGGVRAELGDVLHGSPPRPFHDSLDEDDIAVMAEDRLQNAGLSGRAVSEAWHA
jgi:hypothetical protein